MYCEPITVVVINTTASQPTASGAIIAGLLTAVGAIAAAAIARSKRKD